MLTTAQLAGVMGAKATAQLIPLCHSLLLSKARAAARSLWPVRWLLLLLLPPPQRALRGRWPACLACL